MACAKSLEFLKKQKDVADAAFDGDGGGMVELNDFLFQNKPSKPTRFHPALKDIFAKFQDVDSTSLSLGQFLDILSDKLWEMLDPVWFDYVRANLEYGDYADDGDCERQLLLIFEDRSEAESFLCRRTQYMFKAILELSAFSISGIKSNKATTSFTSLPPNSSSPSLLELPL